jgi:hypothetical protein
MAAVQNARQLREALQAFIDAKEQQLQQTGQLGQRVLEQQVELETRVEQLREVAADAESDEDVDSETRAMYTELADAMHGWDADNVKLSDAFSNKVRSTRSPSRSNLVLNLVHSLQSNRRRSLTLLTFPPSAICPVKSPRGG